MRGGGFGEVRVGSAIPLGQVRPVNDGWGERLKQLRRDWFSKWRDEFGEYSRAAPVGRVRRDAGWVRRMSGFGEVSQVGSANPLGQVGKSVR